MILCCPYANWCAASVITAVKSLGDYAALHRDRGLSIDELDAWQGDTVHTYYWPGELLDQLKGFYGEDRAKRMQLQYIEWSLEELEGAMVVGREKGSG